MQGPAQNPIDRTEWTRVRRGPKKQCSMDRQAQEEMEIGRQLQVVQQLQVLTVLLHSPMPIAQFDYRPTSNHIRA